MHDENKVGGVDCQEKRSAILADDGNEDFLVKVRKTWELGKVFGFSTDNEIDAIWTITKDRGDKKGKKNNSRGKNKGRNDCKSN